jgi:hypothetical protein
MVSDRVDGVFGIATVMNGLPVRRGANRKSSWCVWDSNCDEWAASAERRE